MNTNTDIRIPVVNPQQLAELIVIAELSGTCLIIRGRAGGGKTDLTRNHCDMRREEIRQDVELRKGILSRIKPESRLAKLPESQQLYGYIDCRLTYYDPTDLKGFPSLDREAGVSRWLPPATLPLQRMVDAGEIPENGMWALEEMASASRATLAATFQAVLDREINGEPLAKGWCIIATSNSLDDLSVVNPLPAPLVSRFSHAEFRATVKDWANWAMVNNVQDKLVSFIRFRPELLHNFDPKDWKEDTPYSCPRSITLLSKALDAWDKRFPERRWPRHLITSFIGTIAGNEFYSYLDIFKELPSVAEVLDDPRNAKLPTEASAIFAICIALAKAADSDNLGAIYTYIERFEKMFQIATVKDINRVHPDLSGTKEFQDFILKPGNKEIFLDLRSD